MNCLLWCSVILGLRIRCTTIEKSPKSRIPATSTHYTRNGGCGACVSFWVFTHSTHIRTGNDYFCDFRAPSSTERTRPCPASPSSSARRPTRSATTPWSSSSIRTCAEARSSSRYARQLSTHSGFHPLFRKVLKMRIWEISPAGKPIL